MQVWKALRVVVVYLAISGACVGSSNSNLDWRPGIDSSPTTAPLPVGRSLPLSHPLSAADLEAWLDGYFPFALQRADIAGAVIVVVKNGQVILQKGYGFADVALRRPVNPDETLFRPASVSKLFTWTAVMQQVELGHIQLDQDINTYLDFHVPPFDGRSITVRNLMTHTAGFEESLKDLRLTDPKEVAPLGEFLKRQIPARIFPPGQVPAYSNYGTSLAGYIVQRVSKQLFEDYVEQHVFSPLGMRHSTFRQPLPKELAAGMSNGYKLGSGTTQRYEVGALVPAAGSAVTGADMARFIIAYLQDGEYQGHRILQPSSVRMMRDSALTIISPLLNRMLLGFYERDRNGHRIIGHEGDTPLFHSALQLFPNDNVGLFLSLNSMGRDDSAYAVRTGLLDGFADRYFPSASLPRATRFINADIAKADAAVISGHYDGSRREDTTFASLLNLILQATVTADQAGHIVASPVTGLGGQLRPFEEIAPFTWREIGGQDHLIAKVSNGRVLMWAEDGESPYLVYTRTPLWRDAAWLIPAIVVSLGVLLLTALGWVITARTRRTHATSRDDRPAQAYRWVRVFGTAALVLMLAWITTVGIMAATFYVRSALDPWILALHLLSVVVFPLAAAVSIWNVWLTPHARSKLHRVFLWTRNGMLALSCLVLLWVGLVFHLIGVGLAF